LIFVKLEGFSETQSHPSMDFPELGDAQRAVETFYMQYFRFILT